MSLSAADAGKGASASRRQRMQQVVEKFEGMLWNEVAQAMSSVKMGPSTTGYGGQVYQRMMWRKVASQDFAGADRALTQTTLSQLMGPQAASAQSAQVSGALPAQAGSSAASPASPAISSSAPTPASDASSSDPQSWVHKIWHEIKSAAEALGVPAKALLAQAALETGWGRHATGHNLLGVKAHGGGDSFGAFTHEFQQGVMRRVRSQFQQYPSARHALQDFVSVLKSGHAQAVGQGTVSGYARALQDSGYATDPRYAAKIEAVANSPRMRQIMAAVKNSGSVTNRG
ncbi:glycoside hydrolase family 73 protein [Salinisphaera sp. RV14]